mmetsp:Transcript_25492/g.74327  ORF Transcript_25492/g.74327 Transcript_25492/m.74327 type:complete len:402 (-) Transcript_25492:258-1463(-)
MAGVGEGAAAVSSVVNFTGYKFVGIPDKAELKKPFRETCTGLGLKGLVLLTDEGINFFLAAATREAADKFLAFLEEDERFRGIPVKWSESSGTPFKRMLVKLKKEIIALGDPSVRPAERTGLRLEPREFKRWLDEGREVVVVDTRNDYEVRLGTFRNAVDLELDNFKEFPEAVRQRVPAPAKDLPVVTFCTGGVRCEKATAIMMDQGFREVYQLEGGILRYFEDCGGDHWDGECFVFDNRVALNPQLEETETVMCYSCREPLTRQDQASPDFVLGVSCSHCKHKGKKRRHHTSAGPAPSWPDSQGPDTSPSKKGRDSADRPSCVEPTEQQTSADVAGQKRGLEHTSRGGAGGSAGSAAAAAARDERASDSRGRTPQPAQDLDDGHSSNATHTSSRSWCVIS